MQASEILDTDPELILIRKPFSKVSHFLSANLLKAYYDTFADGYKNYANGDWKRAKKIFEFVPKMKQMEDKPSEILLKFMAETNFVPPEDWKGVREVDI